uniref:Uncharacterized protein n=1 Tax=Myoviridae sp. ctagO6 TaxID=2826667 RepID=A0A8S5NQ16_9CAUD|nr:MAG TPA: hypothetical protein [Myoviridae sp. ctagO6]
MVDHFAMPGKMVWRSPAEAMNRRGFGNGVEAVSGRSILRRFGTQILYHLGRREARFCVQFRVHFTPKICTREGKMLHSKAENKHRKKTLKPR